MKAPISRRVRIRKLVNLGLCLVGVPQRLSVERSTSICMSVEVVWWRGVMQEERIGELFTIQTGCGEEYWGLDCDGDRSTEVGKAISGFSVNSDFFC